MLALVAGTGGGLDISVAGRGAWACAGRGARSFDIFQGDWCFCHILMDLMGVGMRVIAPPNATLDGLEFHVDGALAILWLVVGKAGPVHCVAIFVVKTILVLALASRDEPSLDWIWKGSGPGLPLF
jgi:hypothetical protein